MEGTSSFFFFPVFCSTGLVVALFLLALSAVSPLSRALSHTFCLLVPSRKLYDLPRGLQICDDVQGFSQEQDAFFDTCANVSLPLALFIAFRISLHLVSSPSSFFLVLAIWSSMEKPCSTVLPESSILRGHFFFFFFFFFLCCSFSFQRYLFDRGV